jgi:hypothetical protein
MRKNLKLVIAFSAFLLTMCRAYEEPVSTIPGLSCRSYKEYFQAGDSARGLECHYTCPNGTVSGPFESKADPSLSATKGDLDRRLCNVAPPTFTPAVFLATSSPTVVPSGTLAVSPTTQVSGTAEVPVTGSSLLTGKVLMCDLGANLINFRIVQPSPDLTGETMTARIADMESMCYVNPTNPSLLTCTLPSDVTFPAQVVVSLDGVVVNDFTYSGIGCEVLTTAIPTTTP